MFNVTVSTNFAPIFETDLVAQFVLAGEKLIYTLPKIVDRDGYQTFIRGFQSVP